VNTTEIAKELLTALDHGKTIPSIAQRYPGFGWDDGYEIAAEIVKLRRARGEQPVGRKIGFTNRKIWPEYGATSPIWAHVYDNTLIFAKDNTATLSLKGSARPKLEPEIAFKLRAPLPTGCRDPTLILESIEWLAPSFEIVDCHFADWKFQPADAAADFSLHWKLIVGTPYRPQKYEINNIINMLHDCRVSLSKNIRHWRWLSSLTSSRASRNSLRPPRAKSSPPVRSPRHSRSSPEKRGHRCMTACPSRDCN
jgi:2-keto-4-pentenoate hydratase